ncbi:hypothetical protein [Taibaiella soli]|uniref:Lipocalin-like domain-containing protein n=1 Tax=Taibaiella soli TaxID=1649169 RepID=A0A2W2AHI7_9BACT|nr:hypothetical protein [Taibaiella soli]PZF74741.1 hypothetical protein DN068_00655 [Taibaiella soli]
MKKFFLAASLISVAFASCKPGDGDGIGTIPGKWYFETDIHSTVVNGKLQSMDTVSINDGSYMEFTNDGKIYSYNYNAGGNSSYFDTGSYRQDGNILYMTDFTSNESDTLMILKITTNHLQTYTSYQDVINGDTVLKGDMLFSHK